MSPAASRALFRDGRFFTAVDDTPWAQAIVVEGDRIEFVGSNDDAARIAGAGARVVDLDGRLVLPGFIDAHTHLTLMGEGLDRVQLIECSSLAEVQQRLLQRRTDRPDEKRILGRGWRFDAVPGGLPTAAMIDAVVPDVPVYLDSYDYHTVWLNSAALDELGIDGDTADTIGGRIERDPRGEATGFIVETAREEYVWPFLSSQESDADRDAAVDRAFEAYLSAGVVGAVEMMLDEVSLATMLRAIDRHGGRLPIRVAAHWFIANTGDERRNLAQLDRAAELAARYSAGSFRIVGIKLVLDGVIDACTAALSKPFADGSIAAPIWSPADLAPVVACADAAGLQIAMHAIGDVATTMALDAIEAAQLANGRRDPGHRLEHIEYTEAGTAERMARLGVTASMQPAHTDAMIRENWTAMLGDERADRGFAWPEYEGAGALLAFSTDAPAAPHDPFANLFVAVTRGSAFDPALAANEPDLTVTLADAIRHATRDAAASMGDGDTRGRLAPGHAADFAVVDTDPFATGAAALLRTTVVLTVIDGRTAFSTL